MLFTDDGAGRLVLRDGDRTLAEYVYAPTDPATESPRPYALLHTRRGVEVTAYRPDDHAWHKGLSLALPAVGPHNFWGGPTYVHDAGYVPLPNNGAQVHRAFRAPFAAHAAFAVVDESLDWVAADGSAVLTEERFLAAHALDEQTWALSWRSRLRNVAGMPLAFGSPTTKGRPDAGYAGIFWRGPTSFTGGRILGPHGPSEEGDAGESARRARAPWAAFIAPDCSAGILMLDASPASGGAVPWFARSGEYAGLGPAPFSVAEAVLAAGETMELAAVVVIGDATVSDLATTVGARLAGELRTPAPERGDARS